jgi:hypothetical protein
MVGGRRRSGSRPDSRLGLAWPAVTHGGWWVGHCSKTRRRKKKNEEDDGSALVFLSYFLKIQ